MITVCQAFTDFKGANNTWQRGHFRPQSFEYALYEASLEMFNIEKKEWEKSQVISDNLKPFFKSVQVAVKFFAKGGMIEYPKDYSQFSSLRYFSKKQGGKAVMCSGMDVLEKGKVCRPLREEEKADAENEEALIENDIDKIDNQRWGAASSHEFIVPDINNPICTQYNDGFKVLPKSIGYVVLDYLSTPVRPKFAYRRDDRHNIICLPDECINLAWGQEMLPELMSRVKTKYASFISNPQKYAEAQKEIENIGS